MSLSPLGTVFAGFALAAGLTLPLCLGIAALCRRLGVLDRPAPRRIHRVAVPRLGGIGIFVAFVVVSLLLYHPGSAYEANVYRGLLLAAGLIVLVMAVDDVRCLPPLLRLGVQTLAAALAMFPGAHGTLIEVIHNPLVGESGGQTFLPLWIAIPFTWFWIVGMMNTINWVDGLDGLAAGVVTITALVMTVVAWLLGQQTAAVLSAALAGVSLGFLLLNWHPARLFMGDSGAMFLGLALAVLANVGGAKLATMLLLLGLPILDTARVLLRRVRQGRSPLLPDTAHLHHRLLAGGLSQRQVVLLFYAITGTFGVVTIVAAYLQVHAARLRLHPAPWLNLAVSEVPVLVGLALVCLVSMGVWRLASARRARLGLPPGASSVSPRLALPGASGSHPIGPHGA